MAKGSHAKWGGWEPKECWQCGRRITLKQGTGSYHYDHETGTGFSLCGEHGSSYMQAKASLRDETYADLDPNQLAIEDLL